MNQRLRNIALCTLTLTAAMAGTSTASAATTSTRSIASATALQLAQQTVAACSAEGYNVSASVLDRSGVLLAMVRADGAGPHTVEASRAKAFTSASSRNPTSGIAKAIQSNPDAAGMANIPGFLVLGGGVPLKIGNETIGAIGVAGAPGGHLDEACAQKAITALKDQLQ
ncbi:GlcG/HbpS family heme-binding protein [Comamonas testosteroni]|uniref:GlcG/HbpS family heme-binding protein n=1 Tax=Comamonas testosteroni TaxID=285 RepID=UPI00265DB5C6|nr:heme-binding protein [Comamonas testosteroni]WKL16699.1 heme-binding protein [Comamonas testosteroni]WQD44823.1 heme-binding protein [Comamonas testosteroni]